MTKLDVTAQAREAYDEAFFEAQEAGLSHEKAANKAEEAYQAVIEAAYDEAMEKEKGEV